MAQFEFTDEMLADNMSIANESDDNNSAESLSTEEKTKEVEIEKVPVSTDPIIEKPQEDISITTKGDESPERMQARLILKKARLDLKNATTPEEKKEATDIVTSVEKTIAQVSPKTNKLRELYTDDTVLESDKARVEALAEANGFIKASDLDKYLEERDTKRKQDAMQQEFSDVGNNFLREHPEYTDPERLEMLNFYLHNVYGYGVNTPMNLKLIKLQKAHEDVMEELFLDESPEKIKKEAALGLLSGGGSSSAGSTAKSKINKDFNMSEQDVEDSILEGINRVIRKK